MVSTVAEMSCAILQKGLCTLSPKYACHRELLRKRKEPAKHQMFYTASGFWKQQEYPLSQARVLVRSKGCSTFGLRSFLRRKTSRPSCRASRISTTCSWSNTRATPGRRKGKETNWTSILKTLLTEIYLLGSEVPGD